MASDKARAASRRRTELRDELWSGAPAWIAANEVGFFQAPRTLPLLMSLIASKKISGKKDASSVYLELLARHYGEGIVEAVDEIEHAYASGYEGTRAVRTWRERIRVLESAGFIQIKPIGNRNIGAILIVHPSSVLDGLRKAGKIEEKWWNAYVARRTATGEQARNVATPKPKVIRIKAATKDTRLA